MFVIPPEPSTLVEQAFYALSECSRRYIPHPTHNTTFKIKQNLTSPYISISGPSENVRMVYDVMQSQLGFGEEVSGYRFPKDSLGFYLVGTCPFGEVYKGLGRSRTVFRFCDLNENKPLKAAITDMRDHPTKYFEAYLAKVPDQASYFAHLQEAAKETLQPSQLQSAHFR